MTITLDLTPEVESRLLAQAQAKGVSLTDYVEQIVEREALETPTPATSAKRTGRDLIKASAKLRGLFTDEEVDTLFRRSASTSRPVNFE